jgi:hypothetical protein
MFNYIEPLVGETYVFMYEGNLALGTVIDVSRTESYMRWEVDTPVGVKVFEEVVPNNNLMVSSSHPEKVMEYLKEAFPEEVS